MRPMSLRKDRLVTPHALRTSMFGYPIGAYDDLPSVGGISGPMECEDTGSERGTLP